MMPVFVICCLVALIEIYYWLIWFPKNKHTLREHKDWENYVYQVWKKGHGVK